MPDYLPVMLKTARLPCLVVGGGKIARRKVLVLLRFGARVTVVAEELNRGLAKLADRQLICWRRKKFGLADLLFQKVVIAATDDPVVNRQVSQWADRMRILCNSVDNSEQSGFIFPAIYHSDPLTVAISTQGYYPAATKQIKRRFAKDYGGAYGEYLKKLKAFRQLLKTSEGNPRRRRHLLNRLLRVDSQVVIGWNEKEFKEWLGNERG